jgi:hexulose-6-phosphate isomerase
MMLPNWKWLWLERPRSSDEVLLKEKTMFQTRMCRRDLLKAGTAAVVVARLGGKSLSFAAEKQPQLSKALYIGMLRRAGDSDTERFALAKRCGFEGVEADPLDSLDAMREQAEAAKEAGLKIHGLMFNGWRNPLSDPDPQVVAKGVAGMERALRCANAIGASTVLLVPAVVTENVTYAQAYERSQKHIRELIPLADEMKVVIAVENVWNKFLLSPLEFARYIDEFESKRVQAYFDIGNFVIHGYPQDWIRTLGKRIVKLHVKDFKREGYQWTNLLEGDVNWREVRRAIEDIGYRGWMTAELRAGEEEYLTDVAGRMDKIIAM